MTVFSITIISSYVVVFRFQPLSSVSAIVDIIMYVAVFGLLFIVHVGFMCLLLLHVFNHFISSSSFVVLLLFVSPNW